MNFFTCCGRLWMTLERLQSRLKLFRSESTIAINAELTIDNLQIPSNYNISHHLWYLSEPFQIHVFTYSACNQNISVVTVTTCYALILYCKKCFHRLFSQVSDCRTAKKDFICSNCDLIVLQMPHCPTNLTDGPTISDYSCSLWVILRLVFSNDALKREEIGALKLAEF